VPSTSTLPVDPLTRIQGIIVPPHYNDKPDMRPSCKGFVLVTFAHLTDCEYLKDRWPWFRETRNNTDTGQLKAAEEIQPSSISVETIQLARLHSFRVISKERWLRLKAEYLTYRQQLVEMMNASQDSRPTQPRRFQDTDRTAPDQATPTSTQTSTPIPASHIPSDSLGPTAPYPTNCLVFAKNIHPQTTKTTLRSFLSQALPSKNAQPLQEKYEGLDYVDFSKGMDTVPPPPFDYR
jgi:hypothetical protein